MANLAKKFAAMGAQAPSSLANFVSRKKKALGEAVDAVGGFSARRGAAADSQRSDLRLARETKSVRIDPAAAAGGDRFSQRVVMARGTRDLLIDAVKKRKEKLAGK